MSGIMPSTAFAKYLIDNDLQLLSRNETRERPVRKVEKWQLRDAPIADQGINSQSRQSQSVPSSSQRLDALTAT
jgi:hypothetical protein